MDSSSCLLSDSDLRFVSVTSKTVQRSQKTYMKRPKHLMSVSVELSIGCEAALASPHGRRGPWGVKSLPSTMSKSTGEGMLQRFLSTHGRIPHALL